MAMNEITDTEPWIMKLYVINPETKRKIYLKTDAQSKTQFKKELRQNQFKLRGIQYTIDQVHSEPKMSGSTITNVAIGGAIGLIGGPFGMLAGAAAGGFIGKMIDDNDRRKSRIFNTRRGYGKKKI